MPGEKMVSEWALEWLERQLHRGLSQTTRATNCATPGNEYEILCRSSKHVV